MQGEEGAVAAAAGDAEVVQGTSPGVTSPARGTGRGTQHFACGRSGFSLPGGLKLILEKGILLVFRAFN